MQRFTDIVAWKVAHEVTLEIAPNPAASLISRCETASRLVFKLRRSVERRGNGEQRE